MSKKTKESFIVRLIVGMFFTTGLTTGKMDGLRMCDDEINRS